MHVFQFNTEPLMNNLVFDPSHNNLYKFNIKSSINYYYIFCTPKVKYLAIYYIFVLGRTNIL